MKTVLLSDCYTWRGFTPDEIIPKGAITKLQMNNAWSDTEWIHDGYGQCRILGDADHGWTKASTELNVFSRAATKEEMHKCFPEDYAAAPSKPETKDNKLEVCFHPYTITQFEGTQFIHNGIGELAPLGDSTIAINWGRCMYPDRHKFVRTATAEEKKKYFPGVSTGSNHTYSRAAVTVCAGVGMWIHDGYGHCATMDKTEGMVMWFRMAAGNYSYLRYATREERAKYKLDFTTPTKETKKETPKVKIPERGAVTYHDGHPYVSYIHDGKGNYSLLLENAKEPFWVPSNNFEWDMPHRKATPEEMAKYFPLSEAAPSGSSMKFPATTQVWTRKDDEIKIDDYAIDYGNVVGHKAMANYFEDKTRASNEPVLDSILVKANGNAIRISPHLDGYKVVNDKDYTVYAQVPDLACATKIGCALCGVESFVDASIRHIYKTT